MQVSNNYSAAPDPVPTTPPATGGAHQALGQEDFLKLLAQQFQQQDPMKPMDDTAFISQMAQFTSLSQTNTMTQQLASMQANQSAATASSYLGRQVTVDTGDGSTTSGLVSGVDVSTGTPRIVVGDYTYSLAAVRFVEPAPVETPAPVS
jgi:flagellar basal-body rod modification protein FlgD